MRSDFFFRFEIFRFEKSIFGFFVRISKRSKFSKKLKRFSSFFIEILKGFKIQNVFFSEIFLRSEEIFKIFKIHFFLRSRNVRNFDIFFEISKLSKFSKFSRYPFLKFRNSQNCLNLKSGMSFFSKVFF